MTDTVINYESINNQINTIRQVMKGSLLSRTLELWNARSSESSEQYSSTLVDLEIIIKCNFSKHLKTRIILLRTSGKVDIECDQNSKYDAFDDETNGNINVSRKWLERVKKKVTQSVLLFNTHTQQWLALYSNLTSSKLIEHSIDCGFY